MFYVSTGRFSPLVTSVTHRKMVGGGSPNTLPVLRSYRRMGWLRRGNFSANTKHTTVKPLLEEIKDRHSRVKVLFTDQCCRDRRMLESSFERGIKVYLDTFHCKQRVPHS